jgi:flagellar hook-associated protein 2
MPEWTPPPIPKRTDNLAVLSLSFSDGSKVSLRPITDSGDFIPREFNLSEYATGKTITALNIDNANTHREISVKGAMVFDPKAIGGGLRPLNPVSIAQDAIIEMEGIKMQRPSNNISDIIPGVSVTARGVSDRPVKLNVSTDREGIKNSIIELVGNYNRLMVEINVLSARSLYSGMDIDAKTKSERYRTNADDAILNELTYLSADEKEEMRSKLGAFHEDNTLSHLKNNLMRTVSAPYTTDEERELAMLAQIGISTYLLDSGGGYSYNPAGMRGYLQIDEKKLDAALEQHLPAIRQLFGSDTNGDLIIDSGVAFNMDNLSRPFVETGGIISLKTGTIDSRISQDRRRIDAMDRRLPYKEAELKAQYSRMEDAYSRMEKMSTSLENFSRQNGNNR